MITTTAFFIPFYLSWRIYWANRMPIMDCDEVYNYWEPLHYLLYEDGGMQTWEYSPDYALRSYLYLYPLQILAETIKPISSFIAPHFVDHAISSSKMATFVCLRSLLAASMGLAELLFLRALVYQVSFHKSLDRETILNPMGGSMVALLLLTCTGMNHAAGALLPSSTVLCIWLLAAAAYLSQTPRLFCAPAVIATLCLAWPFGVVVFIPMGIDILFRTQKKPLSLLLQVALFTVATQFLVMYVDYPHYGRWTSSALNIFQYNVKGGGDELYGVEPFSYYLKNLALNFNYLPILALLFLPLSGLMRYQGQPFPTPLVVIMSSLYLWLALVGPRAHKEERFLFPIYPCLIVGAVVVTQRVWTMITKCLGERFQNAWILLLLPSIGLSVSRTVALSKYYTAPFQVYAALPAEGPGGLVCVCGEWHRFPSHFYLPSSYRLGFLPSSFGGQLPQPFSTATKADFNDENRQEASAFSNPDECMFIVEMETSSAAECLAYTKGDDEESAEWIKVASIPYLDAATTPALHRILYLPGGLHQGNYLPYSLYAKKSTGL